MLATKECVVAIPGANLMEQTVKVGDVVVLREKSRKNEMIVQNFQELASFNVPYIEKQMDQFGGKLIRLPERDEIPIDANERLIVEYYSK